MNFILNCKFRFCLLFILFLSFHSIANDDYNKKSNNLITEAQLVEDPTLLLRLFIPALIRNDVEGVGLLLSIYEKQKKQEDDELLIWGNAIIARKNKQLDKSISLYRSLVSRNPKLVFARLQLAIALFENKENEAALEQFDKLKSENLNDNIIDIINKYSELINHQNDWSFNGGIVYLNESNINNSPKLGVNTANWKSTSKPESAEGFSYVGVAEKKLSIYKNYFSLLNFRGKGKYYWDNSKYNEISSRVKVGFGYKNLTNEVLFLPFVEYSWNPNKNQQNSSTFHRYSNAIGTEVEINNWLNKQWKNSLSVELSRQSYHKTKLLDGNVYSVSDTLLYISNSNQYWFSGIDFYHKEAKSKANAFDRFSVRAGWGQEWLQGISTRFQVGYAKRIYQGAIAEENNYWVPDFYKKPQKNDEYSVYITLWNRNFYFYGITPKITWAYQKIDSSNLFYSYDKNNFYLEFSKYF